MVRYPHIFPHTRSCERAKHVPRKHRRSAFLFIHWHWIFLVVSAGTYLAQGLFSGCARPLAHLCYIFWSDPVTSIGEEEKKSNELRWRVEREVRKQVFETLQLGMLDVWFDRTIISTVSCPNSGFSHYAVGIEFLILMFFVFFKLMKVFELFCIYFD
jgi:hypothetical protein